jgi:hypothetical protein
MLNESRIPTGDNEASSQRQEARTSLPPAWQDFVRYCADLDYGEIEKLRIQNGLPVLAELTRKKVKFGL